MAVAPLARRGLKPTTQHLNIISTGASVTSELWIYSVTIYRLLLYIFLLYDCKVIRLYVFICLLSQAFNALITTMRFIILNYFSIF